MRAVDIGGGSEVGEGELRLGGERKSEEMNS